MIEKISDSLASEGPTFFEKGVGIGDGLGVLTLSEEEIDSFFKKIGDDRFLEEAKTRSLLSYSDLHFSSPFEKEKKEVEEKLPKLDFYKKYPLMDKLVKKAFIPDESESKLEEEILPILEDVEVNDKPPSIFNRAIAEELVSEELLDLFNEEKAIENRKMVKDLLTRELGDTDIDIDVVVENMHEFLLDYLQDWDKFEMDVPGNPNLKKTILKNIIDAEINLEDKISQEKLELLVDLQKKVKEVVAELHFFRATDIDVLLNNILGGDKRWKSQFETHNSNGALNPSLRSERESGMFGFPDNPEHDRENRPIYGFFTPDKNGVLNSSGGHPPYNATSQYGRVHCKVKKEVALARATLTFQDSLTLVKTIVSPTPVAMPSLFSMKLNGYRSDEKIKNFINEDKMDTALFYDSIPSTYTEVQYHDGLSLSDIESIHVSPDHDISEEEIENLREVIEKYNQDNPDQAIEFIIY